LADLDQGKRMMAILGIDMPKFGAMEDSSLVHALAAYAEFGGDARNSTVKNIWYTIQVAAQDEIKKRLHLVRE